MTSGYRALRMSSWSAIPNWTPSSKAGLTKKRSYEKFIPEEYLFNSVDVRASILRGLIDADGSLDSRDKKSRIEYSTSSEQLKNDVKSQLEIEKFKHKEYNIESSGDDVFDIKFGDSFLLENDEIVNVPLADREIFIEDENKIRLVAKRIEYSITKPQQGPGGLRRRINGSKVFT